MKRTLTLGIGALALAGMTIPTSAADLGARPITKAPVAAPVAFSWTGFYIGVHAGGSWFADDGLGYVVTDPTGGIPFTSRNFAFCGAPAGVAVTVPVAVPFGVAGTCRDDDASFLVGGQIGYNLQVGTWVFGVEADGSWRDLDRTFFGIFGNNTTAGAPFGSVATDTVFFRHEQGALGTLRGRLGWAPGNWLLYVTGGLAVGEVEHTVLEVLAPGTTCAVLSLPGAPTNCRGVRVSDTEVGWTVGAGFEFALGGNWSIGAEYLFVDLGDTTVTLAPVGGFFTNTSTTTFENTSHIARAKLNFRFSGL